MRTIALFAVILLFTAPGDAAAFDRFVNPFGTCSPGGGAPRHTTIQEAVAAAAAGDRIAVCPGTYEEVVNVSVPQLTIAAQGHVVIRPPTVGPAEPAFNVAADDVTIRGFEIAGFGVALILAGNRSSVHNNRILDVILGIDVRSGSAHRIRRNVIELPFLPFFQGDTGIFGVDVDALTISGNRISGGNYAIALLGSAGSTLDHNLIFDTFNGIFVDRCVGPASTVRNNTIRNTLAGIAIVDCDGPVVRQNAVTHSEQFGIVVVRTTDCSVSFNAVGFSSDLGIDLRDVGGCVIERNVVTRNTGTACMWDGLGTNKFSRNSCATEEPPGAWD